MLNEYVVTKRNVALTMISNLKLAYDTWLLEHGLTTLRSRIKTPDMRTAMLSGIEIHGCIYFSASSVNDRCSLYSFLPMERC